MTVSREFRTGKHAVFMVHAHLIFVTKYRRDALSHLAVYDLSEIFARVCAKFEAELVACITAKTIMCIC